MNILQKFQTEAALQDRLEKLAKAELRARIGTLEHDAITSAIHQTHEALAGLQVELYGVDDPDDAEATVKANTSEWGWAIPLLPVEPPVLSAQELSDKWHMDLDR